MLVLSRKENQQISFPELGIVIEILNVRGSQVRVGVDAPLEVRVLRQELTDHSDAVREQRVFRLPQVVRHELRNQLNLLSLCLHVLKREIANGTCGSSEEAFERLTLQIEKLAAHQALAAANGSTVDVFDGKGRTQKALLVEDCDNERALLAGFLRLHGLEVDSVGDGEAALKYLEEHEPPDVILLDMHIPLISGSELYRTIRDTPRFDGTLVFVVSGTTSEEQGMTLEGDSDRWFQKPIDPRKLLGPLSGLRVASESV